MKVAGARVNWMDGWGNPPHFEVTVGDPLPTRDELRYRKFGDEHGGDFIAEHEGYVSKIYKHDIRVPDDGFGGASSSLIMTDGSTVTFRGGWHAATSYTWKRPEWGHEIKPFTECVWFEPKYTCGISAWITLELLQRLIDEFIPGVELYQGDYNFYPKRIGEPPKNPRRDEAVPFFWPLSAEQML